MKRLVIALLILAPISGCVPYDSPRSVSQTTVLDERLGIGAESAYTAASRLGAVAARAGLISVIQFKRYDNEAYNALLAVRTAYKAGNATDYADAITRVHRVVAQIKELAK